MQRAPECARQIERGVLLGSAAWKSRAQILAAVPRVDHDRAELSVRPAQRDRLELGEDSLLHQIVVVRDRELQAIGADRKGVSLGSRRQDETDLHAVRRLLDRAALDGASGEGAR